MVLAREDINFENIKSKSDVGISAKNMAYANNMIDYLKDEQFEMRNEIKSCGEIISKLNDDIQLLEKEKRCNMLWRNSLEEDINHTKMLVLVIGFVNVLFTFFMSK
ncbi:hypothetical protein JK161_00380 [Leuconostoc mesenteroides]|uniref:hypothetical protein n=1 Tax=Leuconostoc mesenteroides TaxID=1245 RepID=UPI001B8AB7BC|nr:hypothetical protein [Leuconostoc mesenteroides]MBS0941301.1 hypothetical protein [Leuconostoc mesenteroides]